MPRADSVKLRCPNLRCRKVLIAPATARGNVVRCKHCMTTLRVPEAPERQKAGAPGARG